MNRSILGLAATLALTGSSHAAVFIAHAAVFIDNFESYSPVGSDMNGKGGWVVSNGAPTGGGGPVVIVDNYTWDGSLRSATVGGDTQPSLGFTTLSHTANVALVSNAPSSFKFETSYTESTGGATRNPFKFVLTANSGNLLTIDLTPAGAGQYDVTWSSSFAAGGAVGTLSAGATTQFQIDTAWNGSAVTYVFKNAGSLVSSGTLTGAAQSDFVSSFSTSWNSGVSAGNNSVTIDNVSLVPEPSAALLGLLGTSLLVLRRRRA